MAHFRYTYQKSNIYRLRHCHHHHSHTLSEFSCEWQLISPRPLHISTDWHPIIPNLMVQMPKPSQSVMSHHISYTLNTKKTVQNGSIHMLLIPQRHFTHPHRHHTPSYVLLSFLQAMQIPSLRCPCLSPIRKHTLDTSSINLFLLIDMMHHLQSEWELAQAHLTLILAASSTFPSAQILLFGWHTWRRSLLHQVYHPNKRIWVQIQLHIGSFSYQYWLTGLFSKHSLQWKFTSLKKILYIKIVENKFLIQEKLILI